MTRERDIERHLVKRVKEANGEIRKVKWIGRRGAPDRIVMLPDFWWHCRAPFVGTPGPLFVELKAPGLVAEPHQRREHVRMRDCHCRVYVLDSVEAIDAWLPW